MVLSCLQTQLFLHVITLIAELSARNETILTNYSYAEFKILCYLKLAEGADKISACLSRHLICELN